jgi:hypothetical protein
MLTRDKAVTRPTSFAKISLGLEWKSHLLRGIISILQGGNVMPMEIFVSCVGDLATLGVSLVAVTPVSSPSGSFSLFVCEPLGIRKFLPWQFPCTLAELSS